MADTQSKSDKLAIARKKLKEFEARRKNHENHSPTPSYHSSEVDGIVNGRASVVSNSSSIGTGFNHVNNEDDNSNSVQQQEQKYALEARKSSSFHNGHSPSAISPREMRLEAELVRLNEERNSIFAAYEGTKAQLEQLHGHYSQLHTAYSQMSQNGVHSETEQQVLQLQSALHVLVEEKSGLQSELRLVKEELVQLKQSATAADQDSLGSDIERRKLKSQFDEGQRLLSAQSVELDRMRKDASTAQVELRSVQHERSEAQARLKVSLRDNEDLAKQLQKARSDLHMKDIYLKQAGFQHSVGELDEMSLKKLEERNNKLEQSMVALNLENQSLRLELRTNKDHYESCNNDLLENNKRTSEELEVANYARSSLEQRVVELEDEVHTLTKMVSNNVAAASTISAGAKPGDGSVNQQSRVKALTDEDVQLRVDAAVRQLNGVWERRIEEETKQLLGALQEKDRGLFEKDQVIADWQTKYRLLEERTMESRATNDEMVLLSEQLQVEKATVSRAIAQNRELKEQLLETEDRLMALTEEKLNSELARQSAEHQVKELTKSMELLQNGGASESACSLIAVNSTSSNSASALESVSHSPQSFAPRSDDDMLREHAIDEMSNDREAQLQQVVSTLQTELVEVRNELRRSHTENEQMNQIMRQNAEDENQNSIHVELGQAVAHVQQLAAENERLRDEVQRLQVAAENVAVSHGRHEEPAHVEQVIVAEEAVEEEQPATIVHTIRPDVSESNLSASGVGSPEWTLSELEKRFNRAMLRNAQLEEAVDKLEHVNVQLQVENETIADHVVLYRHQRQLFRERLMAKDSQIASLEADRTKISARCQQLHSAMIDVLSQNGLIKEYDIERGKKTKARRRESRSFSHSTVDEFSGDEDIVVDAADEQVPLRDKQASDGHVNTEQVHGAEKLRASSDDSAVQKLMEILQDISTPPTVTPADKLHCTQCIGQLQTV